MVKAFDELSDRESIRNGQKEPWMEVKSIYVANIMKTYEKLTAQIKSPREQIADKLTISPEAGTRLFDEVMANTIKKSLTDEGMNEG